MFANSPQRRGAATKRLIGYNLWSCNRLLLLCYLEDDDVLVVSGLLDCTAHAQSGTPRTNLQRALGHFFHDAWPGTRDREQKCDPLSIPRTEERARSNLSLSVGDVADRIDAPVEKKGPVVGLRRLLLVKASYLSYVQVESGPPMPRE